MSAREETVTHQILITGGAGFIGSHLADELLRAGYRVRVLDNLSPQVHGASAARPDYLDSQVELEVGDVCDPSAVRRALRGVEAVYHFAAKVGVGQSMYEVAEYTSVNNHGTAVLLEALIEKPVERLIVASSMSLYGEGLYRTEDGAWIAGTERPMAQLRERDWELRDDTGRKAGASEASPLDDHRRIVDRIHSLTGGAGCDCVIEAVGQQWPLDLAGELTRERGRCVIAGYHQDGLRQVNMQLWDWRGIDVINAHERDRAVYRQGIREAVEAVAWGRLNLEPLLTHRFPLDQLDRDFEMVDARPDGFLKALVIP
jgi:hypothetical protein